MQAPGVVETRTQHFPPRSFGCPILKVNAVKSDQEGVPVFAQQAVNVNGPERAVVEDLERLGDALFGRLQRRGQNGNMAVPQTKSVRLVALGPSVPRGHFQAQNCAYTMVAKRSHLFGRRGAAPFRNAGTHLVNSKRLPVRDASGAEHRTDEAEGRTRVPKLC